MRVFVRFLYAMLAVGVFLLVFEYAMFEMKDKYYEEVFGQSLVDETSDLPEFYYFYASFPDYHKEDPVLSINQDGYKIRAYEIAITSIKEEDVLVIDEYLFFLIYHDDVDKLKDVDRIRLENGKIEDRFDIHLIFYQGLDILTSVDPKSSIYLVHKDDIDLSKSYDSLFLIQPNESIIIESALSITESVFTIKDNIEAFYNTYNELPTEETIDQLADDNIQPKEQTVTSNNYLVDEYLYILGIYMGVYFLVLIFSTYFIFFRKSREKRTLYAEKENENEKI